MRAQRSTNAHAESGTAQWADVSHLPNTSGNNQTTSAKLQHTGAFWSTLSLRIFNLPSLQMLSRERSTHYSEFLHYTAVCVCKGVCLSVLTVILVSLISCSLVCLLAGEGDPGLWEDKHKASSKLPSASKLSSISIAPWLLSLSHSFCTFTPPHAWLPHAVWLLWRRGKRCGAVGGREGRGCSRGGGWSWKRDGASEKGRETWRIRAGEIHKTCVDAKLTGERVKLIRKKNVMNKIESCILY